MSAFETTVQRAVYAALNAAGLSAPVYDDVPQASTFPYIVVGDARHADWSGDDFTGTRAEVSVLTYSRARGKKETKELQQAIYVELQRVLLTATGYDFITVDAVSSRSSMNADGLTREGEQVFSVLVESV